MKNDNTADIHSFESMAASDGEGIRYGIFFTGCPLRCVYCHNPDTWYKSGNEYAAEDVLKKVLRFKPYFKKTGGVTFSGGEPLLSAPFINTLGAMLKENGVGYCLDTSGSVPLSEDVRLAIDNADMVILDLKFYDKSDYKKYTGGDIENVLKLGEYCTKKNKRLWLRTVIVPGINDTKEDIEKYAVLAKQFKFEKYELLGFHTMGFFKYEEMDIKNPLIGTPPMEADNLNNLQAYLNSLLK